MRISELREKKEYESQHSKKKNKEKTLKRNKQLIKI